MRHIHWELFAVWCDMGQRETLGQIQLHATSKYASPAPRPIPVAHTTTPLDPSTGPYTVFHRQQSCNVYTRAYSFPDCVRCGKCALCDDA